MLMKKVNFKLLTLGTMLGLAINVAYATPKTAGKQIVDTVFKDLDAKIKEKIVYERSPLGKNVYQLHTPNGEYLLYDETREIIYSMTNPLTKTGTSTIGSGVTDKDYKKVGIEIFEKAFKKHYPNATPNIEKLGIGKGLYLLSIGKMKAVFDINVEYLGISGQPILYKLGNVYTMDKQKLNKKNKLAKTLKNLTTIDFKSPNEKYILTIFHDVSCPYSYKLLKRYQEYLDLGFTLKFALYALHGVNSPSAKLMGTILNSSNPKKMLLKTLEGKPMDFQDKDYPRIKKNYMVGQKLNINATPATIIDGLFFYKGHIDPKDLKSFVEENVG